MERGKGKPTDVPYIVYEGDMVRLERINRRLIYLTVTALLAAAGAWIVVLMK